MQARAEPSGGPEDPEACPPGVGQPARLPPLLGYSLGHGLPGRTNEPSDLVRVTIDDQWACLKIIAEGTRIWCTAVMPRTRSAPGERRKPRVGHDPARRGRPFCSACSPGTSVVIPRLPLPVVVLDLLLLPVVLSREIGGSGPVATRTAVTPATAAEPPSTPNPKAGAAQRSRSRGSTRCPWRGSNSARSELPGRQRRRSRRSFTPLVSRPIDTPCPRNQSSWGRGSQAAWHHQPRSQAKRRLLETPARSHQQG